MDAQVEGAAIGHGAALEGNAVDGPKDAHLLPSSERSNLVLRDARHRATAARGFQGCLETD